MSETRRFVQLLGQALATMALYDAAHPARIAGIARTLDALRAALADDGPLRLSFLDEQVIAGTRPLEGLPRWEWGGRLGRAGVQRLEIDPAPSPDADAIAALLDALRARLDSPATLTTGWERGGMRFGPLAVVTSDGASAPGAAVDDARASERTIDRLARYGLAEESAVIAHLHDEAARSGRVSLGEAAAVAGALASVVLAEADILPPLLALRSFDEYTTTHSCNVAMLSIGLAERLGLGRREVRAIGTAALVHDIGKVRVPAELLAKRGRLSPEEFTAVQRHAADGAAMLARENNDLLAATVAYEHHIHWNGRGGYPVLRFPRTTHFASRIVQVCDIYDAMCTERPYRPAMTPGQALGILRDAAGPQVDPTIAGTFIRFVSDVFGVAGGATTTTN